MSKLPFRLVHLEDAKKQELAKIGDIIETLDEDEFLSILEDWYSRTVFDNSQRLVTEKLIRLLYEADRGDLLSLYIGEWQAIYPDETQLPVISKVFSYDLTYQELIFFTENVSTEYYDIVRGLTQMTEPDRIAMGIQNLNAIYGKEDLDLSNLEELKRKAINRNVQQVVNYLSAIITDMQTVYADKPEWIYPLDVLNTHEELVAKIKLPVFNSEITGDVEDAANYIVDIKYDKRINEDCELILDDKEEYRKYLLSTLRRIPRKDLKEMIETLATNIFCSTMKEDYELFRVFGPCHPFPQEYDMELVSKDPCEMYGGCRMYHCYENENVDEDTEEALYEDPVDNGTLQFITWWEKGICNNIVCQKRIRKRCYSCRMPLITGGWKGYYCSWDCVRADVREDNTTTLLLIDKFESDCNNIGIYDRDD